MVREQRIAAVGGSVGLSTPARGVLVLGRLGRHIQRAATPHWRILGASALTRSPRSSKVAVTCLCAMQYEICREFVQTTTYGDGVNILSDT